MALVARPKYVACGIRGSYLVLGNCLLERLSPDCLMTLYLMPYIFCLRLSCRVRGSYLVLRMPQICSDGIRCSYLLPHRCSLQNKGFLRSVRKLLRQGLKQ